MLILPVHSMFSKVFSGFRLQVVLACINRSPIYIIWQNLHYTVSSDTSNKETFQAFLLSLLGFSSRRFNVLELFREGQWYLWSAARVVPFTSDTLGMFSPDKNAPLSRENRISVINGQFPGMLCLTIDFIFTGQFWGSLCDSVITEVIGLYLRYPITIIERRLLSLLFLRHLYLFERKTALCNFS